MTEQTKEKGKRKKEKGKRKKEKGKNLKQVPNNEGTFSFSLLLMDSLEVEK